MLLRNGPDHPLKAEVADAALESVIQACTLRGLAARPGVLHDGGFADVARLFDDVQFAQTIETRLLGEPHERRAVQARHVLHVTQPVINQTERRAVERRLTPPQP